MRGAFLFESERPPSPLEDAGVLEFGRLAHSPDLLLLTFED
jgi:hypothetical protein